MSLANSTKRAFTQTSRASRVQSGLWLDGCCDHCRRRVLAFPSFKAAQRSWSSSPKFYKDDESARDATLVERERLLKESLRVDAKRIEEARAAEPPDESATDVSSVIITPPPPTPQDTTETSSTASTKTRSSQLPSESASSRSRLSKDIHVKTEALLHSIALLSQRLNVYTGTDYSGIATLRESILRLETLVSKSLGHLETAKQAHSAALATQSARQKEVVQLLERKHSWSAGDLERYMSLIRSEHADDRNVALASEEVAKCERDVEEARASLERAERRQYHEEQIWSDTIRRNSTWVTFGLMGVNMFILLAGLVIIEPWRRRRLVKEIERALEEKTAAFGNASVLTEVINEAVLEDLDDEARAKDETQLSPVVMVEASSRDEQPAHSPLPIPDTFTEPSTTDTQSPLQASLKQMEQKVKDLWSDDPVTLRKIDLTTTVLQSAAVGAAVVGVVIGLVARLR